MNASDALVKYARLLTNIDNKNMDELIIGIVEGETRVIAAGLTMEEIFKERKLFKDNVIKNISEELSQFGNIN
jgi:flotillin